MNALKHGLTAQTSLLPGEDGDELREFGEALEAELRPMGPMQRILVQRIVATAWKLRRSAAAEERAALEMDEKAMRWWRHQGRMAAELPSATRRGSRPRPRDAGTLLADSFLENFEGRDPGDGRLLRITAYELKLEGSLRATMRELRVLQKDENFAPRDESVAPRDPEPPAPEPRELQLVPALDPIQDPAPEPESAPPQKPPQDTVVERSDDGETAATIAPNSPEKRPSQNELGGNGEWPPTPQNESAGP